MNQWATQFRNYREQFNHARDVWDQVNQMRGNWRGTLTRLADQEFVRAVLGEEGRDLVRLGWELRNGPRTNMEVLPDQALDALERLEKVLTNKRTGGNFRQNGDPTLRDEAARLLAGARELCRIVGMAIEPQIAALEAKLSAPAAPRSPAPTTETVTMRSEGELWLVEGLGTSCRLKSSRGVELLARLVREPGRELHALDLAGDGDGVADAGDAGEMLDAEAKAAYKRRLLELREELEEAEHWNDSARVERARDELEALEAELSRATGLGGRTRRSGRAAERARINVQRRLADAIKRIGEASPELGKHLARAVRTGTFCSYAPER
jgi:hypothetical protein